MSDMTLAAVLRRMEVDGVTVHGFRSTFRDWGAECSSAPHEVLEAALAHQVADATVAAYFRSDLFERRRVMMGQWSAFVAGADAVGERVVPIRRAE